MHPLIHMQYFLTTLIETQNTESLLSYYCYLLIFIRSKTFLTTTVLIFYCYSIMIKKSLIYNSIPNFVQFSKCKFFFHFHLKFVLYLLCLYILRLPSFDLWKLSLIFIYKYIRPLIYLVNSYWASIVFWALARSWQYKAEPQKEELIV